jgi:hypothetical protein
MRVMMSKLTVNESKTRVCYLPEEKFDFSGIHVRAMLLDEEGPSLSRHGTIEETSAAHLSSYQRRDRKRQSLAGFDDNRGKAQSDDDRLGQLLLSGASQQRLQCGRYTRPHEAASVVMRQTQRAAAGIQTISGSVSSLRVWFSPFTTPDCEPSVGDSVSLFREPDAVNLPVRFDEREQETEPSQTGLRWRDESQVKYPPGDPNPYYSWRANPCKASSADIHGHGKFAVVVGPIASSTYNLRYVRRAAG